MVLSLECIHGNILKQEARKPHKNKYRNLYLTVIITMSSY